MTVSEVVEEVKRDQACYQLSGGGVTLSGGEPFANGAFAVALLKAFCENWIDTAAETCGAGPREIYQEAAPYLQFLFADIKCYSDTLHKKWTGSSNGRILDNLILLDQLAGQYDISLIYRIPVIPGFNSSVKEIQAIGRFLTEHCSHYQGVELLPYHNLGRGKYAALGRAYPMAGTEIPSSESIRELGEHLQDMGIALYQF